MQRTVRRDQLGRVDGLVSGIGYGALLLGNVAAPALVAAFGLRGGLVAGAVVVAAVAGGVGLTLGHRRLAAAAPDALAVLRRVPSLHGLDESAFEALAVACGPREDLPAGSVLLTAGDLAGEVLLLLEGRCDVFAEPPDGAGSGAGRRLVNQVEGPDLLGEIGVLQRRPRTATVVTTSSCAVRRIRAEDFGAVLVPGSEVLGVVDVTVSARLARWGG
jgi:hypothetical protein